MAKYIKKKALKNAIECCTWYHINKNGELVEGANSAEHEPLYKYSDIKEIIKDLPTRKFKTEPKRTALAKALKWTYGDEPNSSEKLNNCDTCRNKGFEGCEQPCLGCGCCGLYEPKDEPQDEYAKEYEELGLRKLKELRKDEPQTNADQHAQHVESVEPMQTEREGER